MKNHFKPKIVPFPALMSLIVLSNKPDFVLQIKLLNVSSKTMHVEYFNQLMGAAQTQKLVETFFSTVFQPFLFKKC